MQSIKLYIKPYCGWCRQAMDWLDARRVKYQVIDVVRDGAAFEEMVRLSGQSLAPVIDVAGEVLADFGARELEDWWRERGFTP